MTDMLCLNSRSAVPDRLKNLKSITDKENTLPLAVDLDGTLISSDSLVESGLDFVHQNPLNVFTLGRWLFAGKAALKQNIANSSSLNFACLPYNAAVIELIEQAKSQGRKVVLASACDQSIAAGVADYLGCFDEIIASDGVTNRSGRHKRDELVTRYGEHGFDYIGNAAEDLLVWQAAHSAILVDAPAGVTAKARAQGNVEAELRSEQSYSNALLMALRPHQWAKNALILVPLLAAHTFNLDALIAVLAAIFCFCLLASGTYLINDLLDIQDDRNHATKRFRPLAAGTLPPLVGVRWAATLVVSGLLIASVALPVGFLMALVAYLVITLSYSLWLKSLMALDVITLTVLYTLRIVAGSLALELEPTFWILTFSLFIFLSLALVKRYAELNDARQKGKTEKSAGRGYYPADLEIIAQMGVANGFLSILFFSLYIQDPATISLYDKPRTLWLVCPVLMYWICRLWLLTHRGQMHDDPVVFAIRDRVSQVTLLLVAVIFWTAL